MEETSIPITNEQNVAPLPELKTNTQKREIELISKENENFKLIIIQSKDTIIFSASKKNDITATKYKNTCTYKTLHDSNRYFRLFDNAEEIFTQYIMKMNDKDIEISYKDKVVTIKLIYEIMREQKEFTINLKAEEAKVENIVDNLCIQFTNLQAKMNQQEKIIENLKKQMEEQMKINEDLKKVNDEQEKEIKELNEKLKEENKEQIKNNDSIIKKIEDLKNENQMKREEDLKKLQKQKEEYQKEIEQIKKQKDELMLKQNKTEKDINLIFNRSAPYQIQDFKQISEIQNTINKNQTQNQNKTENIQKNIEKILNKINQISNENIIENQKIINQINQISNENQSKKQIINSRIQKNEENFQKEIKEIKENLEIFKEKSIINNNKLILFNNMKSDIINI